MRVPCLSLLTTVLAFGCTDSQPSPTKDEIPPSDTGKKIEGPDALAAKQGRPRLTGEWQQLNAEDPRSGLDQYVDIGRLADGDANRWSARIDDKQLTLTQAGGQYSRVFSYQVKPPRAIDLILEHETVDDHVSKPKSHWFGIYHLDPMTGLLRLNVIPRDRPATFRRQGFTLVLERKAE
jgi:hypothetical protein